MSAAIDFSAGFGRRDLERVKRRFHALNLDRLHRILAELRPAQQNFLHLLPLLCHINHPLLPGFVSSDAPAGIADFNPSKQQLDIARRHSRSFAYKRRLQTSTPIHALYLMGSVGSIGHSRGSDLDFWLCHEARLSSQAMDLLRAKAQRLERSAEALALEVHIFLMDADEFRHGKLSRLDSESSGSTQHGLLLEEFYRSALLLAGRYPLWWLVPPEKEADYTHYTEELLRKRFVRADECLNFGGLANIAENDFFGAGLWQLFKGAHSPYKSVLKILLMEAYAEGFPQPDWLALKIKRSIYSGQTDLEKLDAYLLMYHEVERYLQQRNAASRLELARRCLYFKVGEPLTRLRGNPGWRAEKMRELTRAWGWGQTQLLDLDNRAAWKVDRVSRERNLLVRELTRSYRLLTEFAAGHGNEIKINPEELNLIGRKLYTSLEYRPGTVERINPGISDDLTETELTLYRSNGSAAQSWSLYRGCLKVDDSQLPEPSKITRGLSELLAWCLVNGMITGQTRFHLLPRDCPVGNHELNCMLHMLRDALSNHIVLHAPLSELALPPYPKALLLFVNVGADPQEKLTREGKFLISERANPLSYGSARRCLLMQLDVLVNTSWGELVAQSHGEAEGLLDALCFYLDLRQRTAANAAPPLIRAEGYASPGAATLARRVEQVFHEADRFFRSARRGRYLLGLGTQLYLLQHAERGFSWLAYATLEEALEALAQPKTRFSPPGCDPQTLTDSPLPALFRHCRKGEQQLFYQCIGGKTRVIVLDESGSVFHQEFPVENPSFLLIQQQRFLESLSRLRRLSGVTDEAATLITGPRFYRLEKTAEHGWRILPTRLPRRASNDDYVELRLVAESSGDDVRVLYLACGERKCSALALGERLYAEVAKQILSYRHGGDYPIYLTDIELLQDRYGIPPSGVELLTLKRRVEQRLNRERQQLQSGDSR
jgi:adenylate cyclase class 1